MVDSGFRIAGSCYSLQRINANLYKYIQCVFFILSNAINVGHVYGVSSTDIIALSYEIPFSEIVVHFEN